jgi:serine phosphatase RsbU (regulator of sigma subunit)/anti-sigma regulatory factor (Ser/Thr protein kinase)
MATLRQRFQELRVGQQKRQAKVTATSQENRPQQMVMSPLDIAPNDPIVAYFLSSPGTVELDKLHLDSPALEALKMAGVKLTIPLVSQGELVGLLNLGPRLSEQDYSTDDRGLLNTLAAQAAPAVRVAQLVRERQSQARERERIEQELRVASIIQHTLLPKDLPVLPGWQLAAYYQAAREVGGDFYDFLYFEDGRLGIVIGDVTDKGIPAALMMASTRSVLRAAAQRLIAPGVVLERVNDSLCPDTPPNMFVTCLYAVLDPSNGRLQYANAGHDLPYRRYRGGVSELRATGMPLGLMPDMKYEEKEITLAPGDRVLFYSDGIVEAHNSRREMFGFPRLMKLVGEFAGDSDLKDFLLEQLVTFTGPGWEQEDDVTLVTLQRSDGYGVSEIAVRSATRSNESTPTINHGNPWRTLGQWTLPSEPGNERQAMELVAEAVQGLNISPKRLEALKTAVAEATLNAMEHGNHYQPDVPVSIVLRCSETAISLSISDQGGSQPIPEPEVPDLEAKLAELQTPRGWGLFLIKKLVDEMHTTSDETHHTIELIVNLKGESHAS